MRIAISTGGGDCPGLNAVIRAIVRTAILQHGWEVYGIRDGLEGLVQREAPRRLTLETVRDILPRGGTILGTTNRGNPFRYAVREEGVLVERDISESLIAYTRELGIDGVVFVGGDGTQDIAARLGAQGLPVVGVPKTIDNDLLATDYTFGFDTAVGVAVEALDRLHTTAESHDRTMILEVMGRHAGWIALHAGIAGDADVILLPEIPWNPDVVHAHLQARRAAGHQFHMIVVSEGAHAIDGSVAVVEQARAGRVARLGGAGDAFLRALSERGEYEARVTVLGHVQRGGTPTPFDRILGTRFGVHAVELIAAGQWGRMVALRGTEVVDVPMADAVGRQKLVDVNHPMIAAARGIGVCFGDVASPVQAPSR